MSSKPSEICCHWLEASLVASKFSKIVLGGTAASHTRSGVGGGHFLTKKSDHGYRAARRDRTNSAVPDPATGDRAVGSRGLGRSAALPSFFRFQVPDSFLFSFFVGLCWGDTEG
jgi:hypothetical protein